MPRKSPAAGVEGGQIPARALELVTRYHRALQFDQLSLYEPYPFQWAMHNARDAAGEIATEVLLMAGNQIGKSFSGSRHVAIHATGRYPDGWEGRRWSGPMRIWAGGVTNDTTRDIVQAALLGEPGNPEAFGQGAIPLECIGKTQRRPGVPDALDSVHVKHVSGGWSRIQFKAYEMGRQSWMGQPQDFVWLDEEPPQDIYSQALRAVSRRGGSILLTFTPETGVTDVVAQFMQDLKPKQALVRASLDDVPDLSEARIQEILEKYPPHEREMRRRGTPQLGSGLVFPYPEESFTVEPFAIPVFWPRIAAIDFGYDHPAAGVWVAWNRESDVAYVVDCFRVRRETLSVHADVMKRQGEWIPWAWPHDGMRQDQRTGIGLAQQYRELGILMLPRHFENPGGGNSVEAGLTALRQRFETGRLKVFSHLADWFKEYRMYHYKDGQLVKKSDDLMSATRYALQSLRFARSQVREPAAAYMEGTGWNYDPFERRV